MDKDQTGVGEEVADRLSDFLNEILEEKGRALNAITVFGVVEALLLSCYRATSAPPSYVRGRLMELTNLYGSEMNPEG